MIYELYFNFQHTRVLRRRERLDALAAIVRPHRLDARGVRRFTSYLFARPQNNRRRFSERAATFGSDFRCTPQGAVATSHPSFLA